MDLECLMTEELEMLGVNSQSLVEGTLALSESLGKGRRDSLCEGLSVLGGGGMGLELPGVDIMRDELYSTYG